MQTIGKRLLVIAVAAVLAAPTVLSAGTERGLGGSEQSHTTRASAALTAVGSASGWGRVAVVDRQNGRGLVRSVDVLVFGLDPASHYSVAVDGLAVADLTTDASGDAKLRLVTSPQGQAAVPASLPPAATLGVATVSDASLAPVLQGAFVAKNETASPSSPSVYEERITLADVSGGTAEGVAKVERHADDRQEFATWATGLPPATTFTIVVDTINAGVVTTDDSGQGELDLESPDGDNPLPPELQPVDNIREVEWQDASGNAVLSGTFTGVPDNGGGDDGENSGFTGMITGFTTDGFLLQLGAREITVVVTADTTFDGVADLSGLALGDLVEVEGTFDGHTLTAASVALADGGGDGSAEDVSFKGEITAFTSDGFLFQHGAKELAVVVTADTTFDGFADLSELAVGDSVEVEGSFDGATITAASISLQEGDHNGGGGNQGIVSFKGLVTSLGSDGFYLQHGAKDIWVAVTADTTFDGITGLVDLSVGDKVEATGTYDGHTLTADSVALAGGGGDD